MKKFRLLILISLIIISLFTLISCNKTPKLNKPTNPKIEMTSLTLSWKGVLGVRLYTIEITPEGEEPYEMISSKNYYSLSHLAPGDYSLRVRARGKDEESRDSDWSASVSFTREVESGLAFSLNPDGKSYTLSSKGTATGDIVIPDTYRTYPVTAIAKKAFFNKSDVRTVTFGENTNVVSIGEFAFANCSYLTSVELPSGLTSLGESAFASCRLLDGELVIPRGIKTIPKSAFFCCASLDSIVIPNGVTSVEKLAFNSCTSLTSIALPGSVEFVGEHAFSMCDGVDSLTLGEGLITIDKYAFSAMDSLIAVTIPNSVVSIGEGAFYECERLTAVDVSDDIQNIGPGAFDSTPIWTAESNENEVYVGRWFLGLRDASAAAVNFRPDTVGIASFAFYANESVNQVQIPGSVKRIGYAAFALSSVTTVILGDGVVDIADEAFVGCEQLSKVVLGSFNSDTTGIRASSLKSIGNSAFQDCTVLGQIEFPSTLETVGSYAFRDSGLYTSADGVVYAGTVTYNGTEYGSRWVVDHNDKLGETVEILFGTVGVANYAFVSSSVGSVVFPTSLEYLGRAAFYDCAALASVTLPDTLSRIEDYTFYRCKSLKLFNLPALLTYIGRSAFYKCGTNAVATLGNNKFTFTIPAGVTYIGDFAFYSCVYSEKADIADSEYYNYYGIGKLVIGQNVEYLGANAFWGCSSITEIDLGGALTIGEKAFYKCESLASVNFGSRLSHIGEKAFYKCVSLEAVRLPDSVREIGDYAFYKCESLVELTLGSVERVGAYSFYGNFRMKNASLPDTITYIGKQAFRNCLAMTSVIIPSSVETVEQHAFYGTDVTFYIEGDAIPASWHKQWNSSYRPIVLGCALSEDNSYVIYIIKSDIINLNSSNSVSDPVQEGYTFVGWGASATATTPIYTSSTLADAENGRRLYAIWDEVE